MPNLFKSKKQRKKEKRRERRRAFRQAENSIEDVKDQIKRMDRDAAAKWEQAREALQSGQKAAAKRALTSHRAAQVLMTKLEQKRWVFEQFLTKMRTAQTDNEFSSALEGINRVVQVDPDQVADVFEETGDILGEQLDSDRFWHRLYEKEMDGAGSDLEDHIPSLEDMTEQLEAEAAAEVGGEAAERASGALDERVKNGRDRINDLLDQ